MQLIIRSVETFLVNLPNDSTVTDLKAAIEDHEFIPADVQRLVVNGGATALVGGDLRDLVANGETIDLQLDVAGGMRAKWRKKRMRRLRRKRRKMRQRAR